MAARTAGFVDADEPRGSRYVSARLKAAATSPCSYVRFGRGGKLKDDLVELVASGGGDLLR
jgi:hypothetical protein